MRTIYPITGILCLLAFLISGCLKTSTARPIPAKKYILTKYNFLTNDFGTYVDTDALLKIDPNDVDKIIDLYETTANAELKYALTITLGYVGNERAAKALINTLLTACPNKVIPVGPSTKGANVHSSVTMFRLLEGLGYLANKYDCAFDLLSQGTNMQFWYKNISWKDKFGDDHKNHGLYSYSLIGLANSQRKSVGEYFDRLIYMGTNICALTPATMTPNQYYDNIRVAAEHYYIGAEFGLEYLMRNRFGDQLTKAQWRLGQSSRGMEWVLWRFRMDQYFHTNIGVNKVIK